MARIEIKLPTGRVIKATMTPADWYALQAYKDKDLRPKLENGTIKVYGTNKHHR